MFAMKMQPGPSLAIVLQAPAAGKWESNPLFANKSEDLRTKASIDDKNSTFLKKKFFQG